MEELPLTFMEQVDAIIHANLGDEHFSIELLHKELDLSYSHTHRKIKQKTGLTPSIYIRLKRLDKACFLLLHTEMNISEIAHRVGFNTPNYFSTCFSEHYYCTPYAYRKKHLL